MVRILKNTSHGDFELFTFTEPDVPPYAILSHTWNDGEVTFDELVAGVGKDKAGYIKIRNCGEQAAKDRLEYFWVDTCCINKSSSAELSESINSMYRWYQQAAVCYCYIEDWTSGLTWADLSCINPDEPELERSIRYEQSQEINTDQKPDSRNLKDGPLRWFTRGWTLQELIAPRKMEFFDAKWNSRGFKPDTLVIENLYRITGIAPNVLVDTSGNSLQGICHGQRMSWAAYRETSRIEDIAYCLLGIFHINMPLLYGEDMRAFTRLQEQILASSTDLSLLAWTQDKEENLLYRGIFSQHPREYRGLEQCRLDDTQFSVQNEIIMTNKGARIETSLFRIGLGCDDSGDSFFLSLGCYVQGNLQAIYLKKMRHFHVRAEPHSLEILNRFMERTETSTIYFARNFDALLNTDYLWEELAGTKVELATAPNPYKFVVLEPWPSGYYDALKSTFLVGHLPNFVGYLLIQVNKVGRKFPKPTTKVACLMAIIIKKRQTELTLSILNEVESEDFKAHMQSLDNTDPSTAMGNLLRRAGCFGPVKTPSLVVKDSTVNLPLRIEGEVINRERVRHTESAKPAVRISMRIDS